MYVGLVVKFISTDLFLFVLNPLSALVCSWLIYRFNSKTMSSISFLVIDLFLPVFGFISICIFLFLGPLYRKIYKI